MRRILEFNHIEVREFFLKEESYFNFDLPQYFVFQNLLHQLSQQIAGRNITDFYSTYVNVYGKTKSTNPCDFENVNYIILNNKDGKFAWRQTKVLL